MSERHSILIVDSNKAFATMMQDYLEQSTAYDVVSIHKGSEALNAAVSRKLDLAIVDLGLDGEDGVAIARQLRQLQPSLRLVLIPLEAGVLPPDAAGLDVQGMLSKPFFLPELPERLAEALACPFEVVLPLQDVSETVPTPEAPVLDSPEVNHAIAMLSMELNADAVLLTVGDRLAAHTGRLSYDEARELAHAVAEAWQTSTRVARILSKEMLRFEQSVEGGEYLFYSLAINGDLILSAAVPSSIPLGIIRHRAKKTADTLYGLVGEEKYGC